MGPRAAFDGRTRAGRLARALTVYSLAGFIAGLIAGGVGSRMAMRVSAIAAGGAEQGALTEAGNVVGRITPGGTVTLIVLGGLVGTAGGIIYLSIRPWVADTGRWKGLLFGSLLLCTLGASIIRGRNFDFYVFGPPLLNVTTFASLFIVFGLLVPPLAERIERIERSLPPAVFEPSGLVWVAVRGAGLAFMAGSLLFLALTILGFAPGGPVVHILVAYLVIAVPLAAAWLGRATGMFQGLSDLRAHRAATATAFVVVAAPVLVGLVTDAIQVAEIFAAAR